MEFVLHPRLASGSHLIGRLSESQILLKDNAHFPWILVVPEVAEGIEDLCQLPADQEAEVQALVRRVALFVTEYFAPDTLNVACIGNVVRQMHIHVVGRSENDVAWPGTVWASDAKKPWPDERRQEIVAAARVQLLG